jgi:hypothetical protein
MKIKTFKHNKIEECNLCNKIINTEKDNWCSVIDLSGDKIDKTKFYHRFCLTDLIKGQGRVIAQNFEEKLKTMANGLLKGLKINQTKDNPQEVTFEIKNV